MLNASTLRNVNLSRLLGSVAMLGADWVRLEIAPGQAFTLAESDRAVAHFVVQGRIDVQIGATAPLSLEAGGTAILPHGWAHSVSVDTGSARQRMRYFDDVHDADIPPTYPVGARAPHPAAVVLTAQLHLEWPAELPRRNALPQVLLGTRSYSTDRTAADSAARALEATASRPGATLCLSRFADLLLARELRDVLIANPAFLDRRDEASAIVMRALDAVRVRPEYNWTVERLARHVGMSRSTFAATFKATFRKGPMEAVTAQRMEIAARLLCDSGLRVKAVAAKVGYDSETAFLRRFAAYFGSPPAAYRRARRTAELVDQEDWLNLIG